MAQKVSKNRCKWPTLFGGGPACDSKWHCKFTKFQSFRALASKFQIFLSVDPLRQGIFSSIYLVGFLPPWFLTKITSKKVKETRGFVATLSLVCHLPATTSTYHYLPLPATTHLPLPASFFHTLYLPLPATASTCQYLPVLPPAIIRHYLHLPLPAATCHCLPLSVTTWLPATTSI